MVCMLMLTALIGSGCRDGFVPRNWMRERQDEYLAFATSEALRPASILHVLNHLERARRDPAFAVAHGAVPPEAWNVVFAKLWNLRDTSDFDLLHLLNLLYAFGGHPAAPVSLWEAADRAVLDFKYWYTDPTPERIVDGRPVVDRMWYWSENHVLLFRVNEYLAGQRHPDRTFRVTGMNGRLHMARARAGILRWIEERSRWGFTEWHSDVYYLEDITPLLSLVEWAEDEHVADRARMLLDLVFLDIALHLHDGNFGSTHGRSYIKDKASATTQGPFNGSKLLFDDTRLPYQSTSAPDATLLARARKYRLPEVIRRIARSEEPMVDRERMNLRLPERPDPDPGTAPPPAPHGLDYADEENLAFWWSMGSQSLWMMVPLTLEVGDREKLWSAQFAPFSRLRDRVRVEGDPDAAVRAMRPWLVRSWRAINQSLLNQVNTYTCRTADYMLSTAQDYRKGLRGSQTHIAQATLGERAIVFTQHPAYLPVAAGDPIPPDWDWRQRDEPGPGYWTGNGSEPRSAQHENVVIQIYAPQYSSRAVPGFGYRQETHAYVPHAHFDEVVQEGNWTFARKGDGYVALFSLLPTGWRGGQPDVFENAGLPFDLVASGSAQNVWITECGRAAEWGSFAGFRSAFSGATVTARPLGDVDGDRMPDGYDVEYASPSQGRMTFGWHAPLVVAGVEVSLTDYDRFENPFVRTAFEKTRYEVRDGRYGLILDFATGEREASAGK